MRIVFGWNHFLIKSYSIKELGLSNEEANQFSIERRQKYFHLFWIPFFGIGKFWAVRKDGKLYDLSDKYEAYIESLYLESKTPWYTFAGPLLIVAGFIIYFISSSLEEHQSIVYAKKSFEKESSELKQQISAPSTSDYYYFNEIKNYSKDVYLKVAAFNDTSLKFQLPRGEYTSYSSSVDEIASWFSDSPDSSTYIWINRKNLSEYLRTNYEDRSFEGSSLPNFDYSNRYRLEKIYRYTEGAGFVDYGIGYIYNNKISVGLTNKGKAVTITALKNLEGDVEWDKDLPMRVTYRQEFTITGKCKSDQPSYKLEIVCQDNDKHSCTYLLAGKGFERTISIKQ